MQTSQIEEKGMDLKKTQLGEIPYDWEIKNLKTIAKVQGGYAFKSKEFKSSGYYQIIKMSNLYNGELDLERSGSYLERVTDSEFEYLVNSGDILLTLTGTVGKRDYGHTVLIRNPENLLLNQRVGRIVSNTKLSDNSFLYYLTKTNRFLDQFFFTSRGGTGNQANVSTSDIEQIKIPLPSLPEQRAIAAILSTWDKSIDTLQQLIAAKQKHKKVLMQQLLTGKKRFEEFTEEWQEVRLDEVFTRVKRTSQDPTIESYTISSKRGFVTQEDKFNRVIAGSSLSKYTFLRKDDFSYNKGNSKTFPYGCIFKFEASTGLVPFVYISFKLRNDGDSDADFYKQYFYHGFLERQLKKIISSGARGDGLLNVSPEDFFKLKIQKPTLSEQQKIASVLQAADRELETLERKLAAMKQQKKGLMQQLLTGQTRVKVAAE